MDVMQASHARLTNPKGAQISLNGSPLDLTFLSHQEVDRASDSPLDLSLKTRKRCADTTGHDDDIIFIAQRTPEKRLCYDKVHVYAQGQSGAHQLEQPNGWHKSKERTRSPGNGKTVFPKDVYSRMGSPKHPVGKPLQHLPGEPFTNNRLPRAQISAPPLLFPSGRCPQQGVGQEGFLSQGQRRCIHGTEVGGPKHGHSYPSPGQSSGLLRYHNAGYHGQRTLLHGQQMFHPHQSPLPVGCAQSSAMHPTSSPSARSSVKPTSTFSPSTPSVSPKARSSPFTLPLHPRHSSPLCRTQVPPGSELRAALSSTGRYYPSQTQYSSPVVLSQVTVTQSCSPDTTFSAVSSCPQVKTSVQESRLGTANTGPRGGEHRLAAKQPPLVSPASSARVNTMSPCAAPVKSPKPSGKTLSPPMMPMKTLSPSMVPAKAMSPSMVPIKTLSPSMMPIKAMSPSLIPQQTLSPFIMPINPVSPVNGATHVEKSGRCVSYTPGKPVSCASGLSPKDHPTQNLCASFERYGQNSLTQSNDASAFHSAAKTKTPTGAQDANVKYETPLHISIPCDVKANAASGLAEKPDVAKPVVRDRKLTCKKHMILNAVNQDEALKMLGVPSLAKSPPPTIRTESASPPPPDPPHSPKMPILSPQHHNPPPLASPFVNEPPPLEPTTEDEVESATAVCPNLCAGGNVAGGGPSATTATAAAAVAVAPLPRRDGASGAPDRCPVMAEDLYPHPRVGAPDDRNDADTAPAVKNLSAFVQTGLVLPVTLKPKSAWNPHQPLCPRSSADHKSSAWTAHGPLKGMDMPCNRGSTARKFIPVANVAPMIKRSVSVLEEANTAAGANDDKTPQVNGGKTLDLQAEIAAYKTSLRMPAKLIAKCHVAEDKRTGIAEEFGASKGRFRHIESGTEAPNLRATYGKLFGAKEISKCHTPLTSVSRTEDVTVKTDADENGSRNIWESLTMQNGSQPVAEDKTRDAAGCPACSPSEPTSSPSAGSDDASATHGARKRLRRPSRFTYRRVDGKLRAEKRAEKPESNSSAGQSRVLNHRRHRRSMLDEIANSDGYVADLRQDKREAKVDLFADPALLSREERALQKAMMRFTEMETGGSDSRSSVQKPKRHSNTRQRANQLKRKALRRSPNKQDNGSRNGSPKSSPGKKGFVDFQPEVLQSRTRMQSKGVHSVGGYNRDAAYENELVNDDRRRQLKRARRRAKQMASQRANVRKLHREQKATDRDKCADNPPVNPESPERKVPKKPQPRRCLVNFRKSTKQSDRRGRADVPPADTVKLVTEISPSKLKAQLALDHLDELPDLIQEAKGVAIDGCWEVRDMAGTESLRQTLRSGRKKGGILMKLSWRPITAATKGKPRIAHARVSRHRGSGPKSLRMLQLRRRAQLAFLQATNRGGKGRGKVRAKTRPTTNEDSDAGGRRLRLRSSVRRKRAGVDPGRDDNAGAGEERRITRLQLRRRQRMASRSSRLSRARGQRSAPSSTTTTTPVRQRYPLRDLVVKTEEDDGNTTEEYDFEVEDNAVYSEDDSVYDDRMDSEGVSQVSEPIEAFPEPPELRKLNVNKNSGETVLHRAARLGYEEVALYCLRTKMVDVNARDNAGYTPLHEGCVGGQPIIVRHLLAYGANPNYCTQDGMRPIQYPLQNDNAEVVRLLLSYGADPLLDTYENISPEMVSLINGYLGDLNGYTTAQEEVPWTFYGSALIEGEHDVEHNLFSNVPSDVEDEEEDVEAMFDCSDVQQFVAYRLKVPEAESEDNYVILAHILEVYSMTRAAFLRELGPVIRIYSLSRNTLEEEIMHASSISAPLTTSVRQSQTVEVIRLADVHTVVSHKSISLKGKRSAAKQTAGTGSAAAKSKVRRRLLDPDEDYPRGLPPREMSRTLCDLSAPCNYDSPGSGCKGVRECDLNRDDTSFSHDLSRDRGNKCKVDDVHKSCYTKDNGTRGVFPELLNSSERFLKLNESSIRKVIPQHNNNNTNNAPLPFCLDLNPKHHTVSKTWNTSSRNTGDLDAKNNNNNNNNTTSSALICTLVESTKTTSTTVTNQSPVDR